MKKFYAILILMTLMLSTISGAATMPQVAKPKVFLNTNCYLPSDMAGNDGMRQFAQRLRKEGYRVDHGMLLDLDESSLSMIQLQQTPD